MIKKIMNLWYFIEKVGLTMEGKAKSIMFQGTGSDAGKSVLTTAFCRILVQDGYRLVPFKSQNMALNSFITRDGDEIGRAQAVQAKAAKLEPDVDMNPVLLKPNQDNNSQVIYRGKVRGNMTAKEYFADQSLALKVIRDSLSRLIRDYEIIVLEGAGSPAEINLRDYDLVNMRIAEMAEASVILIADIDRGGVFASIVGTLELLKPKERDRIKGIIINKFRGNKNRFEPGVEFIEDYTGKPVLGVIPFIEDIKIPEEDSLIGNKFGTDDFQIDIAIIHLAHISNFTDFDSLTSEAETRVRYVKDSFELGDPDLIIIPGSKNTIEDLEDLYKTGLVDMIREKSETGTLLIGICGGYQMLGKIIRDPLHLESEREEIKGIGLLDLETILEVKKRTRQIVVEISTDLSFFKLLKGKKISGYEIHQGRSKISANLSPLFKVNEGKEIFMGAITGDGMTWGTYLHGIFDNDLFRRELINFLRERKGLAFLQGDYISAKNERERAYDQLAEVVRKNIDLDLFYRILFNK